MPLRNDETLVILLVFQTIPLRFYFFTFFLLLLHLLCRYYIINCVIFQPLSNVWYHKMKWANLSEANIIWHSISDKPRPSSTPSSSSSSSAKENNRKKCAHRVRGNLEIVWCTVHSSCDVIFGCFFLLPESHTAQSEYRHLLVPLSHLLDVPNKNWWPIRIYILSQ